MQPPGSVDVGQMLLEHAVLQHVLRHVLVPVDQTTKPQEIDLKSVTSNKRVLLKFFKCTVHTRVSHLVLKNSQAIFSHSFWPIELKNTNQISSLI